MATSQGMTASHSADVTQSYVRDRIKRQPFPYPSPPIDSNELHVRVFCLEPGLLDDEISGMLEIISLRDFLPTATNEDEWTYDTSLRSTLKNSRHMGPRAWASAIGRKVATLGVHDTLREQINLSAGQRAPLPRCNCHRKACECFEALSYTWGSWSEDRCISLCGHDGYKVTNNLFAALRRLRKRDKVRRLWVDAVCINQVDSSERNAQVGNVIGEVYSRASRVLVWLGDSNEFSRVSQRRFHWAYINGDLMRIPEKIDWLLRSLEVALRDTQPQWWERVWILQEFVRASAQPTVCFSCFEVPWAYFQECLNIFEVSFGMRTVEYESIRKAIGGIGSDLLEGLSHFYDKRYIDDLISETKETKVTWTGSINDSSSNLSRPHITRLKDEISYALIRERASWLNKATDVTMLVLMTQDRQASEVRDKLYGVLGMLPLGVADRIRPDYEGEVNLIFSQGTAAAVEVSQSLRILSLVRPSRRRDAGTPSWSVDFASSNVVTGRNSRYSLTYWLDLMFPASVPRYIRVGLQVDFAAATALQEIPGLCVTGDKELHLFGLDFDTVDFVDVFNNDREVDSDEDDSDEVDSDEDNSDVDGSESSRVSSDEVRSRSDGTGSFLYVNDILGRLPPANPYLRLFGEESAGPLDWLAWHEDFGPPRNAYKERILRRIGKGGCLRSKIGTLLQIWRWCANRKGSHDMFDRELEVQNYFQPPGMPTVDHDDLERKEVREQWDPYQNASLNPVRGGLGVTKAGFVVLCASTVEVGDVVVLSAHCPLPLALRPHGTWYTFQGFVWVGGIMQGELARLGVNKRLEARGLREFVVC